jgi:hypothetical protein
MISDPDVTMTFFGEIWAAIKRFFLKIFWTIQSRKFWASVAATVILLQSEQCSVIVSEVCLQAIAAVWIAFIVATAWEDVNR